MLDGFQRCLTIKKPVWCIEPADGLGFRPEHPHGFGPDAGYPHGSFFWRKGVVGWRAHDRQWYTGVTTSVHPCVFEEENARRSLNLDHIIDVWHPVLRRTREDREIRQHVCNATVAGQRDHRSDGPPS